MLLSLLIWLPISAGIFLLLSGRIFSKTLCCWIGIGFSLATFIISLKLWKDFNRNIASIQFEERITWIQRFNIEYYLGVDGISMPFILLTTLLTLVVLISGWSNVGAKATSYYSAFLIMEGLIIGVFSALDGILFYLFWEAVLIPMFLIIGIWGGPNRVYASIKFFLYTLLGSLLMLVAILYLYNHNNGSFDILYFYESPLYGTTGLLIFMAFFAAFAVKIPMVPVHTWLPHAHVEAPTGGSVILAAITLKMGAYGFIRMSIPIAPDAAIQMAPIIIFLSLIAIVYIALIALVQTDLKKLIAYSSISHMGFVTLGIFVLEETAMKGALVQMISHGFISGALFLCVGVLYDRAHTREINKYGGLSKIMPKFCFFLVFFAMANAGLPGTSGFVGEFLVILGAFAVNPLYSVIASLTLVLGASYTLWMVKRIAFGEKHHPESVKMTDISFREIFILSIVAIGVLIIGVWPSPLIDVFSLSVDKSLSYLN